MPDRVVNGRDRELRVISAAATGIDPTTLVVSGLGGIGKSTTVLAALRRLGGAGTGSEADAGADSVVRVVRTCRSRPYAHGLTSGRRIDLSEWAASGSGQGPGSASAGPGAEDERDPVGLVEAATAGAGPAGPGPRVLFVDDVDDVAPSRIDGLLRLAGAAHERGWRLVVGTRRLTASVLPEDVESLELGPLDEGALCQVLDAGLRLPVASDVATRLHWWTAGNPRLVLELADALSPEQLRGSAEWAGPDVVGPAARRVYRELLDGLDPAAASDLAETAARLHAGGAGLPGDETLRHPLLALLCLERFGTRLADRPVRARTGRAQVILDGLHLDDLAGASWHGDPRRTVARAVGVCLLMGTPWTESGARARLPTTVGREWTDRLWWRDPTAVGDRVRDAGARTAEALIGLEHTGRLTDPARLRADLDLLGTTREPDWLSTCIRARGHLLLGDVAGARRLVVDQQGAASGRTIAERTAREIAAARIALVEGHAAQAGAHLTHAVRLRPDAADWLPVRGLRAVTAALLGTGVPANEVPLHTGTWSTRAMGEYVADLGAAHLAVGHAERAAVLLTVGLERCAWPYRGRAQARADLVEAADAAYGGVPPQALRLIEPPVDGAELADAEAATAHRRMLAILAGGAASGTSGAPQVPAEEWLPASPRVSMWQRLRSLVAYGRHCMTRGDRSASEQAMREARTLAGLAGVPGWRAAIDASLAAAGTRRGIAPYPGAASWLGWGRLDGDEREFVRLALHGATNAQIAEVAYVSVRTVANRLRQIYAVLGVRDRRDLTERAIADPPEWLSGRG